MSKIAGAAWILEQLTLDNRIHERNAARRIFNEVQRAWSGDVSNLWWKWFDESATSVGLRCKIVECNIRDAVSLVRDGAQLVTYKSKADSESEVDSESEAAGKNEASGEWLAVLNRKGQKFRLAHAGHDNTYSHVSARNLRKLLRTFADEGELLCLVIEPMRARNVHTNNEQAIAPLERLRLLLKPEWSDIWIVLVFAFVVGLLMLATPIAVESLVNTVAFGRFLQPVVVLALMLFMFLGFLAAVQALQTYVVEIIQRRMFARVAADLAYRLPRTKLEAIDNSYMPELVNRFFDVVTLQKVSAQLLLDGIGLVLSAIIGMAVLAFYHPWLLGFDVILLVSIAFIILILGRGAVASSIKESKHKYYMAAWLEDIARSPVTFRSEGGAEFAVERADRLIHDYLSARKSHFAILMRQIIFALGLQAVASTVLLGMGGWLVISGELTLGQLVAAELIVTMIVGAFAKLGKHMESFYDLLASVDKLGILFDLPIERQDGMLPTKQVGAAVVDLNDVSFEWPHQPDLLVDVNKEIPAYSSLAILGNSASGKSTLLDLIYGLRSPTSGYITIDGFDPRDLRPDMLQSRAALVRNCEVFQGTVAENVHMHRPDVSAADVRDCLNQLGILSSILELPKGTDTILQSYGKPLTENQCHLLNIARATVARPGLLLIDGVLDTMPDHELQIILEYLFSPDHSWTLIVTTGRKDIAQRCNSQINLIKERDLIVT